MNIVRFVEEQTRTKTYLIYFTNKKTVIIDSVLSEVDKYTHQLNSLDLNLFYALDTHIHADHIVA